MSNYLPNYRKKIRILRKREEQLRRLLAAGANDAKLLQSAEVVRYARIRAECARREKLSPRDTPELRSAIEKIDARIAAIRAMTPADILGEFRS